MKAGRNYRIFRKGFKTKVDDSTARYLESSNISAESQAQSERREGKQPGVKKPREAAFAGA